MSAKEIKQWECQKCFSVHDGYHDAEYCCPPKRLPSLWYCEDCHHEYEDEARAESCPCQTPLGQLAECARLLSPLEQLAEATE